MSNTVVTLSGDDANLYKAYQRIIAQQAKIDAGLKGVGDQAKKAKTGLDALSSTDFDDLNDSMESLGDLSALTEGITTSTFFKMAASVNLSQMAVDGLISSVQSSIDHFKELQQIGEKSLERTDRTAAGQQEAAKNLVSLTPEEFKQVQEVVIPRIQKETTFVDRGLLSRAYGEVRSILPQDQTEELLATSARLNRLTPDNLVETATSIADIVRNLKVTIPEAVGMLASAQTVFRAPEQRAVARGIADVSSMAINTSTTTVPITEIADQAAALLSVIGKDDAEGRSSITGTLSFMGQLRDPFTQKARDERDKRFTTLSQQRDSELENQRKTELDILKADQTEKKFAATDTTPQAMIARNASQKARRDLERGKKELAAIEKEMARISRLQAVQMTDPGTPLARLDTIASNADLRAEVVNSLAGELAYRDEMEALLTPNSDLRRTLEDNREAISTDPKNADRLMTLMNATPQLQQAQFGQASELSLNEFDDRNPGLSSSVRMRQILDETRKRRNVGMTGAYYLQSIFGGNGGFLDTFDDAFVVGADDPLATARSTIAKLNALKSEIADREDPKAKEYATFVDQQIEAVNKQLRLYRQTMENRPTIDSATVGKPATTVEVKPMPIPTDAKPLNVQPAASTESVATTQVKTASAPQAAEVALAPVVDVNPIVESARIETRLPTAANEIPVVPPPTAAPAVSQPAPAQPSRDSAESLAELRKQSELMAEQNALLRNIGTPAATTNTPPNPALINQQQMLRGQ